MSKELTEEEQLKQENKKQENKELKEQNDENSESLKEKRIRAMTLSYYSRQDIRKAIFEFSKNRECVPRYFEGFGKRPDSFQYESDIIEHVKSGATSFHCSEELWKDPLELSTAMREEEIKKLRSGWDLLIDIDSKYLDYSKIYAEILVEVLKANGIKNIGLKFSGSKGFHLIIPWKAFPKELSGKKTSEMFPEWPRLICQYLSSKITEKLKNRVLDISEKDDNSIIEFYCSKCNNASEKKSKIFFICSSCKTQMQNISEAFERKRKIRCPNCQLEMAELRKEEILVCSSCKLDSSKEPDNFKQRVQSRHIDADLVLVSPRHLFRMPYSLHEKTCLSSTVIQAETETIRKFQPREADPFKIKVLNFTPDSEPGEATNLLRAALEFKKPEEKPTFSSENKNFGEKKFKDITISNLTPSLYPPSIKKILEGMKTDGRKRALFILLSFFKSLKLSEEQISKQVEEWNLKNAEPLKAGYIKAQISWYSKQNPPKMPPNFDKSYYKDIGINPTEDELKAKNPVSYTIRKALSKNYWEKERSNNPKENTSKKREE